MSYALPEKQREYQRLWARKKKLRQNEEVKIENKDGSTFLGRNVVTWDELHSEMRAAAKLKSWGECVKKSKDYIRGTRVDRFAVAALAVRACDIKAGGDRRSKKWEKKDWKCLHDFSKDIGVAYKTLQGWTRAYKIATTLKSNKPIDYTTARNVAHMSYKNPEIDVQAEYDKLVGLSTKHKQAKRVVKYLGTAAGYLTTYGTSGFDLADMEKAEFFARTINKYLGAKRDWD